MNKSILITFFSVALAPFYFGQTMEVLYKGQTKTFKNGPVESDNCQVISYKGGNIVMEGKCTLTLLTLEGKKEVLSLAEGEQMTIKNLKPEHRPLSEIRLETVALTATKKQFSEIEIKQEALQNIQSFSIGDVLQQLPGQFVQKFDNTQFKNIVFRTASGPTISDSSSGGSAGDEFGNKAFGVQLMVNDIALSNNENMQSYNSANSSPFGIDFSVTTKGATLTPSQANFGVDLREIATENIESIEVIQGIPDAKYGDLTSGLIKVTTTAKASPLRLDASLREGTYQVGLSKGFKLKNTNALNVSLDYMNSLSDPRSSLVSYDRVSTNALWSLNGKNVRNKISFSYSENTSKGKKDPDDINGLIINVENKSYSLSNNLRYNFGRGGEKKFFRSLTVDAGLSFSTQLTERRYWLNQGARPYGTASENSVYYAEYTPPSYENQAYADGKPFNFYSNASIDGSQKTKSNWVHMYSVGVNYRYGYNFGRGRYGTAGQFATIASAGAGKDGMRDFNYRDNIFASNQYAIYLQDNIVKRFENRDMFKVNLGLRYDLQNGFSTVSPRINTSYQMKNFTVRLGGGLTTKAPSLNQLYTSPRYYDFLIGDYRIPGYYSVAIMQTVVTPGNNVDLKPSKSWKSEVGFDYRFPFATFNLTAYYNKLVDGFTTMSIPKYMDKAEVKVTANGTNIPTFEIVGTSKFVYMQNRISNDFNSVDKGVELMASFKKIEPLNLVIGFNASYVQTTNTKGDEIYVYKAPEIVDKNYLYGIYRDKPGNPTMARASFSFDYHLAPAGLIIGLRTDHFLLDRKQTSDRDIYPIGYINNSGTIGMIPEANRTDQIYQNLFRKPDEGKVSGLNGKTLHNVHLRVTKDFLSGFRLSVYVSNVFNLKPYNDKGIAYAGFTTTSFGTNISYRF